MNNTHRAVPTHERPWANDGIDVEALLKQRFALESRGTMPAELTPPGLRDVTFHAFFNKSV